MELKLGQLIYIDINNSGIVKENSFLYRINRDTKEIPCRVQYIKGDEIGFTYQHDKNGYIMSKCKINELENGKN